MKSFHNIRTLILYCLCLLFCYWASAQTTVKIENGVYKTVQKPKSEAVKTGQTFEDSKGNQYPIYKTETGIFFVLRTSAKTGKTYKQYLKL